MGVTSRHVSSNTNEKHDSTTNSTELAAGTRGNGKQAARDGGEARRCEKGKRASPANRALAMHGLRLDQPLESHVQTQNKGMRPLWQSGASAKNLPAAHGGSGGGKRGRGNHVHPLRTPGGRRSSGGGGTPYQPKNYSKFSIRHYGSHLDLPQMLRALQPHGLAEVPAPQVPHYTGSSGKSSDDPDAIESLVQGYAAGAEAAGGRGGRGDEARDERRTRSPDEAARRGKEVEMEEPTRAGGAVQGIAATTKATTDGGAGNKGHESGSGGSAQYPDEAQCSPGAAGKKTRRLDQRQKSTWRAGKTEVGGGRKRSTSRNSKH